MDLFRKNKKKQPEDSTSAVHSVADALDRVKISTVEENSDGNRTNDSSGEQGPTHVGSPGHSVNNNPSNGRSRTGSASGIDALIDSDEDLAEIFNDGDSDDEAGNVSMVSDSSHRSAAGEKPSLSPRQYRDQALGSPYGKAGMNQMDADVDAIRARFSLNQQEDDDDDTASEEIDEADDDKSHSDSAEDYTDDEDEGEDGYKPGGYHSVKIGEVFNQR
jgi:hypothetical protein